MLDMPEQTAAVVGEWREAYRTTITVVPTLTRP